MFQMKMKGLLASVHVAKDGDFLQSRVRVQALCRVCEVSVDVLPRPKAYRSPSQHGTQHNAKLERRGQSCACRRRRRRTDALEVPGVARPELHAAL